MICMIYEYDPYDLYDLDRVLPDLRRISLVTYQTAGTSDRQKSRLGY